MSKTKKLTDKKQKQENYQSLPYDTKSAIMKFIDPKELQGASRVSKQWNQDVKKYLAEDLEGYIAKIPEDITSREEQIEFLRTQLAKINPKIKSLDLLDISLDDDLLTDLLARFTELEKLRVDSGVITGAFLSNLPDITKKSLRVLEIISHSSHNRNLTEGHLVALKDFSALEEFSLEGCREITGEFLFSLSQSSKQSLQALNLSYTGATDQNLQALEGYDALKEISLGYCQVTVAFLKNLPKHIISEIEAIDVLGTEITKEELLELGGFSSLTSLKVGDDPVPTKLTPSELAKLRATDDDKSGSIYSSMEDKDRANYKIAQQEKSSKPSAAPKTSEQSHESPTTARGDKDHSDGGLKKLTKTSQGQSNPDR